MSRLTKILTRPFIQCWEHKSKSLLWIVYIIIGGLLGVVINLINRWICGDMSFQEALYAESLSGTFYTYAIVLISSAIGPVFFNISESRSLHFADIKAYTITICIFVMFFCAIFYSNLENKNSLNLNLSEKNNFVVDWSQLIFFILSVLLAIYAFGLEYLDQHPDKNKDIDSSAEYRKNEEEQVKKLEDTNPTSTRDGIPI